MRNSTTNFPTPRNILDHMNKLVDIDIVPGHKYISNRPPRALLPDEPKDESVEAKWEHLQYYEEKRWVQEQQQQQQQQQEHYPHISSEQDEHRKSAGSDSSYSSLASSSSSNSQSPSSSSTVNYSQSQEAGMTRMGSTKARIRQIKRQSWQKIKEQFSTLKRAGGSANPITRNGTNLPHPVSSISYGDFTSISTVPNGMPANASPVVDPISIKPVGGVIPKIRSTKSMQNLEQITRDSYYNIRDVTTNIREKYHSRVELNKGRPKTDYHEFWDEDSDMDEEDIRRQTLEMVGLY